MSIAGHLLKIPTRLQMGWKEEKREMRGKVRGEKEESG